MKSEVALYEIATTKIVKYYAYGKQGGMNNEGILSDLNEKV